MPAMPSANSKGILYSIDHITTGVEAALATVARVRPGSLVSTMTEQGLPADVRVLLVSGSTREGSGNSAALRTLAALAPAGVTPVSYAGLTGLPAFNPDHDGDRLPAPAAELRREIGAAAA